jgi:hypothetical protein
MTGALVVVAFLVFAGLMVARKLPALLAVPCMAIAIAFVAGVPASDVGGIVANGSVLLAKYVVTLIFGALLGRVAIETGIAETIVAYAAEFGGEKPLVVSLVMCAAVTVLFTTLTGLGAIIMVGTIVLPILMTLGVPRTTAATLFLMAFGLGFALNLAQWTFYESLFGVARADLVAFGAVVFVVQAIVLVVYALVQARRTRGYATWAVAAATPARKGVPPWALVAPVLPLALFATPLHVDALVAFAVSALYAVLVTKPREAVRILTASAIRGVEDVAPAILLMVGIGMLLAATKAPAVAAAVTPLVAAVTPRTPLTFVIVFGLLSPLALYRGPLNPFGVGIAVYSVVSALHALPPVALAAAVMAVVQVQNVCDPTNTQNVWVANFTGVGVERITRLTLPFQVGVSTLAALCAVLFGAQLFGRAPFAFAAPAAAATSAAPPGLFAPANVRNVVALATDGGADSLLAAAEMQRDLRSWPGITVVAAIGDPAASDCAAKPYDAVLRATVGRVAGAAGTTVDANLAISDCAGWGVEEWHEQRVFAQPPTSTDIRELALRVLFRFRAWRRERPAVAASLLARGLAIDVAHEPRPTWFYQLTKTDDGYMRALVRPGGPAWTAGLRTNDVVDKIDGRFWWEYGTYVTQQKAYDGKPHTFVITRADVKDDLPFALGAPFVPADAPR